MNAKGMMSSEGSGAHRDTQIEARNTKHIRDRILQSASVVAMTAALFAAAPALAQTATAPAAANDSATVSEIVVTGTRIQTTGFTAPTPTSVIGEAADPEQRPAEHLRHHRPTAVAAGLERLGDQHLQHVQRQQGLSSFSLRGLGTIRTLTLLDGQRVVGAYYTGVTDVSLFPQLLIQRVDVVNGGASASYGSDAVGGVVNFITDTRFTGLKGNVQAGISTYNDDEQGLVQLAGGRSFANDRVHVVASGEWAKEDGVGPGDFGLDLAGDRDWFTQTTMINRNVTNDGSPQYVMRDNAQPYAYTKYGLITAGPLQGIAFDQSGNPFQFQYGSGGVPSKTASAPSTAASRAPASAATCRAMSTAAARCSRRSSARSAYGRIGYDFAENNEAYVSFNLGQVKTSNQPVNGMNRPGLTLQCANPYVPASVQAACATAGVTSFQYGVSNAVLPNTKVHTDRRQYRVVAGLKGKFALGSTRTGAMTPTTSTA
jgi:iron complex outermembrane receptor protein